MELARKVEPTTKSWYAARDTSINNVPARYWMHLVLLGVTKGGDHRNGNTLDNQRLNLRKATHSQNMMNRRRHANNSTGFKGVTAEQGKYRARIMVDNKSLSLGMFTSKLRAAIAYNVAAILHHGEFALLNDI